MPVAERILDAIASNPSGVGFLLLALSACIEYVFPPFPGDLVVVFGAFLVTRRGWPPVPVFASVLMGSVAGFMADYYVGRALQRRQSAWTGRLAKLRPRLDALVARFERHGVLYLVINRFLPSVRALLFVAAGMARLDVLKVLGCGLLSAVLWNVLLFTLGATVGKNWERLRAIAETYGAVATALLAAAVLLLVARWALRRRVSGR